MARLRKLLESVPPNQLPLAEQIRTFVDRALLSRHDGGEPDHERVNLLTLHSTKGLEFSRVYIVGVEDAELLKGTLEQTPAREAEEARRLIYVGMTRAKDRLVLTRCQRRRGEDTGGYRFVVEMGLSLEEPNAPAPA